MCELILSLPSVKQATALVCSMSPKAGRGHLPCGQDGEGPS
jgi:hypothetical protein